MKRAEFSPTPLPPSTKNKNEIESKENGRREMQRMQIIQPKIRV